MCFFCKSLEKKMESEGLFNCLIFNIMKKIITSILALSLIVSCQINELASEHVPADDNLYASIEPVNTTKTVMDDNNNVLWSDGDKLVAFMKTTLGVKYQIMEQFVGTTTGGFSKLNESGNEDDLESGQELDHNVVLYPHSYDVWCMKNDDNVPTQSYRLNVMLPEAQSYEENTFGVGTFPMIAVSPDNKLTFRNICGGLKLQFKGVDKIKSIKLEGLGGEKISGKSTVVGYVDGSAPVITMASDDESYSHVILDCGEGVQLSETTPTTFIIAVPPMEFASGLKITVTDTDGLSRTLKNSSSNTIKRSSLLTFPVITYEPETPDPEPVPESVNLSEEGTANSYIVSSAGLYKFSTVKGNSRESVGTVASAEVLWETFGTDVTPNIGDLVKNAVYSDGYITFQTADTFKDGNAVIAAKDASGTILWSWHIWLTDEPEGQVYYNNAGTMMDRNLGATSATPGDVEALGLFYQWGRKDPFLGLSSISEAVEAISTITWPSAEKSNAIYGTIEYATANPTTFITSNDSNYDWYYTGSDSTDNTRWTTSETKKSIYDPCPVGWRVPDGGKDGVWSRAGFEDTTYDSTNQGISFSISSPSTTWYPGSIYRHRNSGSLNHISCKGFYWSASPYKRAAHYLLFNRDGSVNPSYYDYRAYGSFVRCAREESVPSTPDPESVDLSEDGTANSYIVSASGAYKFCTVKGNSSESVGAIASAEVLWESFCTDVTPNVGDLVKNAAYSDGYITFQTAEIFKEGNAVIAAKDASGNILWSWHIWLTDEPEGQVYYNNAGTMMDRNLGATSATPGDVGALGLLYQWGRKDPFLSSSSISSSTEAKSTIIWPSPLSSDSSSGTIEYATANPTTLITNGSNTDSSNADWYYTGSSSTDNTRWTTSSSSKSIYDPCPAGWRVPDGGKNGVWSKATGFSSYYTGICTYDGINKGMNFSGKLGADAAIWYPASGVRSCASGLLFEVGSYGYYWSASPTSHGSKEVYNLFLTNSSGLNPSDYDFRSFAYSVRCVKE